MCMMNVVFFCLFNFAKVRNLNGHSFPESWKSFVQIYCEALFLEF